MLAIRLARVGAKKKPAYRVVVTDKRRARDSRSIEIVGHYNPTKDPIVLALDQERVNYWLGQGAQPSDTVQRLMKYEGPRISPAEKATEPVSAGYTAPPKPAEEPEPIKAEAVAVDEKPEAESAPAAVEKEAEAESAAEAAEPEAETAAPAAESEPAEESAPAPTEAAESEEPAATEEPKVE